MLAESLVRLNTGGEVTIPLDGTDFARLLNLGVRLRKRERSGDAVFAGVWWTIFRTKYDTTRRTVLHWFLKGSLNGFGVGSAYEKVVETLSVGSASLNLIAIEKLWTRYAITQTSSRSFTHDAVAPSPESRLLEDQYRMINTIERRLLCDRSRLLKASNEESEVNVETPDEVLLQLWSTNEFNKTTANTDSGDSATSLIECTTQVSDNNIKLLECRNERDDAAISSPEHLDRAAC